MERRKFALEDSPDRIAMNLRPLASMPPLLSLEFSDHHLSNRQVAADAKRFALYQTALEAFGTPFYAENRSATPPDPQEVADAVARVIAQPAGERPLRTVVATVAQRQAPQTLNDAATHAMQSFLEALNIPAATLAIKGEKQEEKKQR